MLTNTLNLLEKSLVSQASGGAGGDMLTGFVLPMVLIFGIFYFLVILPQKKQQKKHQEMINSLQKGDSVVTNSGIHGKIVEVRETTMKIEIAPKVVVVFERNMIARPVGNQSEGSEK